MTISGTPSRKQQGVFMLPIDAQLARVASVAGRGTRFRQLRLTLKRYRLARRAPITVLPSRRGGVVPRDLAGRAERAGGSGLQRHALDRGNRRCAPQRGDHEVQLRGVGVWAAARPTYALQAVRLRASIHLGGCRAGSGSRVPAAARRLRGTGPRHVLGRRPNGHRARPGGRLPEHRLLLRSGASQRRCGRRRPGHRQHRRHGWGDT